MNQLKPTDLIPVGHRVIVRPDAVEEVTKSGIVLAAATTEKEALSQVYGTVLAVGPEANIETPTIAAYILRWLGIRKAWCKVGDRVMYGKYSGLVLADWPDLRVINARDVVAIVK